MRAAKVSMPVDASAMVCTFVEEPLIVLTTYTR
jgi:hypothetical protein